VLMQYFYLKQSTCVMQYFYLKQSTCVNAVLLLKTEYFCCAAGGTGSALAELRARAGAT